MKKMTCRQLGGACGLEFQAETFEEMAALSKQHGTEMYNAGDKKHLEAIDKMKTLMQVPGAMAKWFAEQKEAFDEAPEI